MLKSIMAALFDLSDEIQLIGQAPEDWHTEPEIMFYALRACSMAAVIVSVFEGEKTEKGCVILAYGRYSVHEIEIRENAVMIGSKSLDDKDASVIERFFVGPADAPASWEGTVRHIFKAERAILMMVDFAGRLRDEWAEFLRIRRDRLGF